MKYITRWNMEAGKRIRAAMTSKGKRLNELASDIGYAPMDLQMILDGYVEARISTALKIAKALDVDIEDIWVVPTQEELDLIRVERSVERWAR